MWVFPPQQSSFFSWPGEGGQVVDSTRRGDEVEQGVGLTPIDCRGPLDGRQWFRMATPSLQSTGMDEDEHPSLNSYNPYRHLNSPNSACYDHRVNIILFESFEASGLLPRSDPRARHILEVLRREVGDTFDAGVIDGPRGKGTLLSIEPEALTIEFSWGEPPPPLNSLTVAVGLPRPQTCRKILQEATALGASTLHFVLTEQGEASYAQSSLWTSGEWRSHLIAGAQQAFNTRLPQVSFGRTLSDVIATVPREACRIALDNYEAPRRFGGIDVVSPPVIALGPERGWSARERQLLREHDFSFVHLGTRVLRTETACVAAISLARAKLGLM